MKIESKRMGLFKLFNLNFKSLIFLNTKKIKKKPAKGKSYSGIKNFFMKMLAFDKSVLREITS